jgi:hypothetical protein
VGEIAGVDLPIECPVQQTRSAKISAQDRAIRFANGCDIRRAAVLVAGGIQYDSGSPFQFESNPATVLAEYSAQVLSRTNFVCGLSRVPSERVGQRGDS